MKHRISIWKLGRGNCFLWGECNKNLRDRLNSMAKKSSHKYCYIVSDEFKYNEEKKLHTALTLDYGTGENIAEVLKQIMNFCKNKSITDYRICCLAGVRKEIDNLKMPGLY